MLKYGKVYLGRATVPGITKKVLMDITPIRPIAYNIRKLSKVIGIHRSTVKRHLAVIGFLSVKREETIFHLRALPSDYQILSALGRSLGTKALDVFRPF